MLHSAQNVHVQLCRALFVTLKAIELEFHSTRNAESYAFRVSEMPSARWNPCRHNMVSGNVVSLIPTQAGRATTDSIAGTGHRSPRERCFEQSSGWLVSSLTCLLASESRTTRRRRLDKTWRASKPCFTCCRTSGHWTSCAHQDYEADRLMVSNLQLSEGTVVLLDETELQPGQVCADEPTVLRSPWIVFGYCSSRHIVG